MRGARRDRRIGRRRDSSGSGRNVNGTGGSQCLVGGAKGIRTAGLIRLKSSLSSDWNRLFVSANPTISLGGS
jgi:hypothetical protein